MSSHPTHNDDLSPEDCQALLAAIMADDEPNKFVPDNVEEYNTSISRAIAQDTAF